MKKQNIVIGVAPTKRSFLSMEEAKRQKEKFMAVIRGIHPDVVMRKRNTVRNGKNNAGGGKIPPGKD